MLMRYATDVARVGRGEESAALLLATPDAFEQFEVHRSARIAHDALERVAQSIRGSGARLGDFMARRDRQTFAVLMPNADAAIARQVAVNLREAVRAAGIPHGYSARGDTLELNVGIGWVARFAPGTLTSLIVAAEDALERAAGVDETDGVSFRAVKP
jgi:PleD family two-component response regulator